MRITLAFCWAVPFFSLANAAAAGHRNGHYALRKGQWRGQRNDNSTDTVGAENFEGLRISTVTATETVTQQVQVTVAGEPVTVTQEAAKPSAVTVTETVMLNGKGATTTVTETVAGTCEGPASNTTPGAVVNVGNGKGVGVSLIPIAASELPTTTFTFDPYATQPIPSAPNTLSAPNSLTTPIAPSAPVAPGAPSAPIVSNIQSDPNPPATAPASVGESSALIATSSLDISTSVIPTVPASVPVKSDDPVNPTTRSKQTASGDIASTQTEATALPVESTTSTEAIFPSANPDKVGSTKTTSVPAQSTTLATSAKLDKLVPTKPTKDLPGSTTLNLAESTTITESLAPTVNLGGLDPQNSAQSESVAQDTATAVVVPSKPLASINSSSLSLLSSVLVLGNLIPATATIQPRAQFTA